MTLSPCNGRNCVLGIWTPSQCTVCLCLCAGHLVLSNSATTWTAAHQASLSLLSPWNLLRLMSIESVMPSNHLILCRPLLLQSSILNFCKKTWSIRPFPMGQLFATDGQSIGASASASVLPMNIQDRFPLELPGLMSLQSKGLSRVFSNTTVQKHQFFGARPSLWSNLHICTRLLEGHNWGGRKHSAPLKELRKGVTGWIWKLCIDGAITNMFPMPWQLSALPLAKSIVYSQAARILGNALSETLKLCCQIDNIQKGSIFLLPWVFYQCKDSYFYKCLKSFFFWFQSNMLVFLWCRRRNFIFSSFLFTFKIRWS